MLASRAARSSFIPLYIFSLYVFRTLSSCHMLLVIDGKYFRIYIYSLIEKLEILYIPNIAYTSRGRKKNIHKAPAHIYTSDNAINHSSSSPSGLKHRNISFRQFAARERERATLSHIAINWHSVGALSDIRFFTAAALLPDVYMRALVRLGKFIASRIQIPENGEVEEEKVASSLR